MPEKEKQAVKVNVIEVQKAAAVVEWKDKSGLKRAIVPAGEILDGKVNAEILEAGIEYGLPWERLISISVKPADYAEALRTAGIWTADDVLKKQPVVRGVLNAVLNIEFSRLLQIATAYSEEVKHA